MQQNTKRQRWFHVWRIDVEPASSVANAKLKAGITLVSLITEKPIIPVIFEYVESAQICKKKVVYMISVLYNSVHRIM